MAMPLERPVRDKLSRANVPLPLQLPPPASRPGTLLIEHANIEDKIYDRLRTLILERHILPGGRIQVDELARAMGVSRTPVVVALKRLALENVVEIAVRRGVFVKRLTRREIARLFEVREMIEGLSARRAATRIQSDEVEECEKMFRSLDLAPTPKARATSRRTAASTCGWSRSPRTRFSSAAWTP